MLATKWDQPILLNDSFWYSGIAQGIAKGNWFDSFFDVSGAEHGPLTPLLLAPVSGFSRPEFWQRALMTVFGIAALPLIALVGRRLAGHAVGVVAVAIAAVYPNIWMSDSLIMSETIAMAGVSLAVWAALVHRRRFTWRSAAVVGVAVGLAGLARSELLALAVVFAAIGIRRARREWALRVAVLLGATVLTILPWVAYNLSRYEEPVFMSTNDGTTLLGANCPLTYASGHALGGWQVSCIDAIRPNEDPSERSARQRRQAIDFAKENLDRVPVVLAARVGRTLDVFRLGDQIIIDRGEERWAWSVWIAIPMFWVLAPLGALGWRRLPRGDRLVVAGPVICVAITTIFFYGSHRLRAPAEPAIVLCAAVYLASRARVRHTIDRCLRTGESSRAT
jgi:4-amino-4-deoxy-L-arabinose transferase-like glycosyltransferase